MAVGLEEYTFNTLPDSSPFLIVQADKQVEVSVNPRGYTHLDNAQTNLTPQAQMKPISYDIMLSKYHLAIESRKSIQFPVKTLITTLSLLYRKLSRLTVHFISYFYQISCTILPIFLAIHVVLTESITTIEGNQGIKLLSSLDSILIIANKQKFQLNYSHYLFV